MPRTKLLRHLPDVAGLDEAGRGPLAGPVAAAAVILPAKFKRRGLNDSKQLTAEERLELEKRIQDQAIWSVAMVSPSEIDRLNILWASMEAMRLALCGLSTAPDSAVVDGNRVPPGLPCPAEAVIKGDAKVACIAAASILAKCARDRVMVELAETYPGYGFDRHFGYPTPEHFAALRELGPCPIHRQSFGPVRDLLQPALLL
ncbi:MAG: ribonuclease HII [Fimbriimonas sp.]